MSTIFDARVAALERENTELRHRHDLCDAELAEARAQQTATPQIIADSTDRRFVNQREAELKARD